MGTRLAHKPLPTEAPKVLRPISHADSIINSDRLELVGFVETNEELLKQCCQAYSVKGSGELCEMLEQARPDLVCIATRTPPRHAIIEKVLDYGVRYMHVEKPLCNQVSQLLQLEARNLETPFAITLGAFRRYCDVYLYARSLAYSGQFGSVESGFINFGAGPLMWTHAHSYDLASFMANDKSPLGIMCFCEDLVVDKVAASKMVVESDPIHIFSHIRYRDFDVYITPRGGMSIEFVCTSAIISVDADGKRISLSAKQVFSPYHESPSAIYSEDESDHQQFSSDQQHERTGTLAALLELTDYFKRDANDCRSLDYPSTSYTFTSQRLLFAAVESAISGQWVDPCKLSLGLSILGKDKSGNPA